MSFSSLSDDLHFEIFRRLSPTPQFLARAAAVCRDWRRIVNDPEFLRRLNHGVPVTMGFFHNRKFCWTDHARVMVPVGDPASISFDSGDRTGEYWMVLDCRHGRVLLGTDNWHKFVVWHPMTGERHLITAVGQLERRYLRSNYIFGAALLCDCVKTTDHDHGGETCHTSPYRVAVVFWPGWSPAYILCVTVFSSLTGQWRTEEWVGQPRGYCRYPCVVIGNTLYQSLTCYKVVAFDTDAWKITATFERPGYGNFRLYKADGGVLGHAAVKDFTLHMWTRDADTDTWALRTKVDLRDIIDGLATTPLPCYSVMPVRLVGVDEEGDALFLWCTFGIFMLRPKTMELTKVLEIGDHIDTVYPYAALYLPHAVRTITQQLTTTIQFS